MLGVLRSNAKKEAPNHHYRVGRRWSGRLEAWPPGGEQCWPLDVESCSQIVPCPVCRENSITAGMSCPPGALPGAGVSTASLGRRWFSRRPQQGKIEVGRV